MKNNLANYTVEELKNIARVRNLRGFSKLKKQELMDKIEEAILDREFATEFFKGINEEEFEVFTQATKGDFAFEDGEYVPLTIEGFGYAYVTDKGEVKIDEKVKNLFNEIQTKEFKEERQRQQLILNYCDAAINLYGICSDEKIIEIINNQNNTNITKEELSDVLFNSITDMDYHDGYIFEKLIPMEGEDEIEVSESDLMDLLEKQGDKDYFVPAKEEFLKYRDLLYFEQNEQSDKVYNYFCKKTNNEELSACILQEIHDSFADGIDLNEIFRRVDSFGVVFKDEKELKECVDLIMELGLNTRMKENRGFTPLEIGGVASTKTSQPVRNEEKVGRNEPCPCDSGKKYKKCCGK